MAYPRREKKEIYETIFEENAFPPGELLVTPRDVLMRFIKVQPPEVPEEMAKSFSKILTDTLHFYPSMGKRENIVLNIPMGHRYTKFVYVVDPAGARLILTPSSSDDTRRIQLGYEVFIKCRVALLS